MISGMFLKKATAPDTRGGRETLIDCAVGRRRGSSFSDRYSPMEVATNGEVTMSNLDTDGQKNPPPVLCTS